MGCSEGLAVTGAADGDLVGRAVIGDLDGV